LRTKPTGTPALSQPTKDLMLASYRARSLVLSYLNREISCRKTHNPSYSMRAFARDIGLPQSSLANVMSGRQNVSLAKAKRIVQTLGLQSAEKSMFLVAADLLSSRSATSKHNAYKRFLTEESMLFSKSTMTESFDLKSDWYYFALEELLRLDDCQHNVAWLSQRLGFSKKKVKEALDHLIALGSIVKKSDKWIVAHSFASVGNGLDSIAVRHFHGGILAKASQSLQSLNVNERVFGTFVFPIKSENIPKINQTLISFRRELASLYEDTQGDGIYALGTFLVPLTTSDTKREKTNEIH
jgi:uncharacterized protein (TIGR02147 family)